jgi:hypothetical protein
MNNTNEKDNNNVLDAALRYRMFGYSVIPVGRDKKPLVEWKRYQVERATTEQIKAWWKQYPEANVGIVTGKEFGIVVVDVENGGRIDDLPPTVKSKTGGGGFHYYYKHPGDIVKNGVRIGNKDDKRDIRGDGGFVVAPPSVHASGDLYEWVAPPDNMPFAEFPARLVQQERVPGVPSKDGEHDWERKMGGVLEGERNGTAAEVAGKLLVRLPEGEWETFGWPALSGWNAKNNPPMDEGELRTVWESICGKEKIRRENGDDEERQGTSQSDLLVGIIVGNPDIVLFHDEQKEPFVGIPMNGHREIWSCKSKAFRRWLGKSVWDANNKTPNASSMSGALNVIEGMACHDGEEHKLNVRVARLGDAIWYDLADGGWRAVKVTEGGWAVEANPPILFRRYPHQRPQVAPATQGDVKKLLQFVNITNEQHQILLLVHIVSCFIPDFPHAIPLIYGPQGSAKSVLSKIIRRLIDPSLMEVNGFPRDAGQLAQQLAHHWCLFFDNVSELPEWLSDTFCKAVTGDGFSKRELYSDDDDIIYAFQRCIGINGINLVARKSDFLERSILLELDRVPDAKRLQEQELWKQFENERPVILGGIFNAVSKAMGIKPTVRIQAPYKVERMADFTVWGCAIAEAIGFTQRQFLDAYRSNIKSQNEEVLGESLVATAVRKFMDEGTEWEGTPSNLLDALTDVAKSLGINTDKEKEWPKAANSLGRRLNELKTNLATDGITVERTDGKRERIIRIKKESKNIVETVVSSEGSNDIAPIDNDMGDILPPL